MSRKKPDPFNAYDLPQVIEDRVILTTSTANKLDVKSEYADIEMEWRKVRWMGSIGSVFGCSESGES